MGRAAPQPRRYTAEAYFTLEETGLVHHEFFAGEVSAMAGESQAYNLVAGNLYLGLWSAMRGRGHVSTETVRQCGAIRTRMHR